MNYSKKKRCSNWSKAAEKLTEAHVKQVLNYPAAAKLRLGLLVNFGSDALEWRRVIL